MSEHEPTPSPSDSDSAGVSTIDQPIAGQGPLRCQWCSVPLADGVTVCPTCGSPGIPDPRMTVPGLTEPEIIEQDPLAAAVAKPAIAGDEGALVEWWNNETSPKSATGMRREILTYEEAEQRRTHSLIFIGCAIVVGCALGWLIGPALLESPFESLTGANVENASDLRSMGTIGGLITGMFVGAAGGWVIWSTR